MNMALPEYQELRRKLGKQLRSPQQLNSFFAADCEIIKVAAKKFITTSLDAIGEEIAIGLYQDVETWAWMTVMNSVSDLAASGSAALGISISTEWAFSTPTKLQRRFFSVIHRACQQAKVPLLGGDTGYAKDHVMTSSVLGHSSEMPLTRLGAKAGDYLVLSHPNETGLGPLLAYQYLFDKQGQAQTEKLFRPLPNWKQIHRLRSRIVAAIDTSDGLLPACYTLAQLNDLGFELNWTAKINHPKALRWCQAADFSPLMLWVGDLGDLQCLLVVSPKNLASLPRGSMTVLGQLTKAKKYRIGSEGKSRQRQAVDLPMREIMYSPGKAVDYRSKFIRINQQLQQSCLLFPFR